MSDREPPRLSKPFRLPPAEHRVQQDIDREFRFHIEARIEGLVAGGMSREAAEAEIRRKFGDYRQYSEETRNIDVDVVRSRARQELLHSIWRNARLALRTLARTPGFSVLAIITLSLGIGATAAIFSVLDSVVLRPLPFARPDELVALKHPAVIPGSGASNWGLSAAGYHYIRAQSQTLADVGVFITFETTFIHNADAERVPAARVSASLVNMLGLNASLGRTIMPSDDQPNAEPVVVLSHDAWKSRFGSDDSIIGTTVALGGFSVRIIGVMRPGAVLPFVAVGSENSSGGAMHRVDFWLPSRLDKNAPPVNAHFLQAVARVKPVVAPQAVEAELNRLVSRFPEEFPTAYSTTFIKDYQFRISATPLRRDVLGSTERVLWLLLGAVALVFIIAAANVANLFLVRAEVRRRETGIRAALGAGRGQLALHYVSESLLLALVAAILGVLIARLGVQSLLALAPDGLPRLGEVHIGLRSIVITAALAAACGVVFGLFPLAGDPRSVLAMRDGGRGSTVSSGRLRVRSVMVVGQVTLALVLLAGAGLMVRTILELYAVRPGFDARGVLVADLPLSFARYRSFDDVALFHRTLVQRVSALPGVTSAGLGTSLPLESMGGCAIVYGEGRANDPNVEPPCVTAMLASPGYFAALGIPVRGRVPTWADLDGKTGAVVVTRALAERLWPGQEPLGRGVRSNGPTPPYYRVVGVVDEIRGTGLERPPTEVVFYPMKPIPGANLWQPPNASSLVLRSDLANPSDLTASVRRIVTELDRSVPLANVRTMETVVRRSTARTAFIMALLSVAAAMAVILSAVGLYAVISYVVAQRRAEIGIRMALGARVDQVSRLIMVESLQLAGVGVLLGIGLSLVMNRMLSSLLFEVQPTDPLTLAAVSALLVGIAALASLVPARRASRVDPIEVLRG